MKSWFIEADRSFDQLKKLSPVGQGGVGWGWDFWFYVSLRIGSRGSINGRSCNEAIYVVVPETIHI